MNYFSRMKVKSLLVPSLGALLGTIAISWQTLFKGKLFGDLLDARFTIVVNEHWYKLFTGKHSLTDSGFFYPYPSQIGFSDGFFATGMLSIPFRIYGFNITQSWIYSNILLMFLCLFFATLFLQRLLGNNLLAVIGSVLISSSYPFLAQAGHLQTFGYLLIFPILLLTYECLKSKGSLKVFYFFLLIISLEILSLSSWYAFVFTIFLSAFYYLVFCFISGFIQQKDRLYSQFRELLDGIAKISTKKTILLFTGILPLAITWIAVYFRSFGAVSTKEYSEFVFYAPRWGDLFNSSVQSWGLQSLFNKSFHLDASRTFESALGVTPILLIAICVMLMFSKKWTKTENITSRNLLISGIAVLVIVPLSVVTDEAGHSVWGLIWFTFEPLRRFRAPFRVAIFLSWMAIVGILYLSKQLGASKVTVICLSLLLFFDSWRPMPSSWTKAELLDQQNTRIMREIIDEDCDSFFINPSESDVTPWITQVDSMIISSLSNIPTINGYSGNWPDGWPVKPYWGRAEVVDIKVWFSSFPKIDDRNFCFIEKDFPDKVTKVKLDY